MKRNFIIFFKEDQDKTWLENQKNRLNIIARISNIVSENNSSVRYPKSFYETLELPNYLHGTLTPEAIEKINITNCASSIMEWNYDYD